MGQSARYNTQRQGAAWAAPAGQAGNTRTGLLFGTGCYSKDAAGSGVGVSVVRGVRPWLSHVAVCCVRKLLLGRCACVYAASGGAFVVWRMCVWLVVRVESLGILAAPGSGCCRVFVCAWPVVGQAGISTDHVDIASMPGTRLVCWLCHQRSRSCYTCSYVTHLRAEFVTHRDVGGWAAEHSPGTFLNAAAEGLGAAVCCTAVLSLAGRVVIAWGVLKGS